MPKPTSSGSLGETLAQVQSRYMEITPTKIRVLDSVLALCLFYAAVIGMYCAVVGTFPFNSFLAAFIACAGYFVFTGRCCARPPRLRPSPALAHAAHMPLPAAPWHCPRDLYAGLPASYRMNLTDTELQERSPYVAYAEYALCALLLLLVAVNYVG